MKVIEVEGRTSDDATKKALAELGIRDSSKVNVEVIDQGKSGIFGFGVSRPAKVRIYYNESTEDVGDKVKVMLVELLQKMGIEGGVKDLKEGESKVYVELESRTSSGLIIGKKGKTLEALQFMINLMINNVAGSDKKIILDIESYRDKREKALKKMSKDMAFKVIKSGRPLTLEPMNPFERRLIHLTLQNDKRVTTKSEGQGIYRKIKISPSNGNRK
ncbi:MAG TPA: RNA-binding cell elongation regulator Jag/EloR [Spirochaetota bacterium]|nr:RNA-binding cell elongation regulator Jag/EloR [Spirochaetota bacterium]HPF07567.1 RNA-binding cell elongation regulator Jag/EloR [Spirochaetota bacterium]HPJ41623.1 RNA-binding cell elongation regulator Jag/EloR [Spirochaetota bacterium]HPR36706.1 RNA-binding cell elongation regulator Jag/EloR [Spirochaetota bacterium]HRX47117.1 RNA-binding cell elongation regulator Jag/EloR [Spirochaetota bacterium]